MHFTVYKITNIVNGKIYIGKHQTTDLNDGYMGSGKRLKDAIKHHGIENFKKEILFDFDNEVDMNNKEAELVTDSFVAEDTNYNLCPGGNGGWGYINKNGIAKFKGKSHTEETKQKILESRQWYKTSDETKQKISESNKMTNQSRGMKTSRALSGKPKTEEHKRKIAESVKRRHSERNAGVV